MKHSGVFGFFDITRKNCQSNLVVVLVLKKVSITSHSTAFSIISLYYYVLLLTTVWQSYV